jgi:hypothetical protein
VGWFTDTAGRAHGMTEFQGQFTQVDVSRSISTQIIGLNNRGDFAGDFVDASGIQHGFLKSGDVFTTIDPPGSIFTFCFGQNERNSIVGSFTDPAGRGHAFLDQVRSKVGMLGFLRAITVIVLVYWLRHRCILGFLFYSIRHRCQLGSERDDVLLYPLPVNSDKGQSHSAYPPRNVPALHSH